MRFKITWDDTLTSVFFQGSLIIFDPLSEEVHFTNRYFSAGSTIIKWQSNVNYNFNRSLMQLPLLKKGRSYKLTSNLRLEPPSSLLIKLSFYNRASDLISISPLESNGGVFIYPSEAYYYEIELINTGVKELTFYNLILSDLEEDIEGRSKD